MTIDTQFPFDEDYYSYEQDYLSQSHYLKSISDSRDFKLTPKSNTSCPNPLSSKLLQRTLGILKEEAKSPETKHFTGPLTFWAPVTKKQSPTYHHHINQNLSS
jgi:hypothetical protein